jgi:rhodanese-related sulfurtransferase
MTATAFQRLSPAQAVAWLAAHPDALLLDARDAAHHAAGHVEGSVRLDGRNHERLLLREAKARPVLIYCYHGNASQTWASMFVDFGFGTVADIVGGWTAMELFDQQHPGLPLGSATSASASASAPTSRSVPPALADWLRAEGFDATRPDQPGQHGNTPLMHAAWRGHTDMVNALLALGVPLEAVNSDGNNALWLACVNGEPALIRSLVAAGVPVDHANLVEATALMYGASSGKHQVVATLLDLGANPHLVSQDDWSALDMAASIECLQLLRAATRRAA